MLSEGSEAPGVCLPGYVNGERERVDLGDALGDGIVVLAFYPADFNPACSMQTADLGDLDLFTMQKDVSVFGISPDSTYSHEAFAERYGLKVPLLSDVDGEAATAYDVTLETETGESLCQRAVFVVDHRGVVEYAWATDDLGEQVDVDPVKAAVGSIGGDETALERYRVGYDHYAEGRAAFTEAMGEYQDREWLVARSGFEEAEPAFTAAADHFDTAVRFAETDDFETVVDRAEEKADTLQHAANWLADSADALGSGRGKEGNEYREDADRLLSAASDLPEPPESTLFTLTDDGIALDDEIVVDPDAEDEGYAWRAEDPDAVDTGLGVDDDALDAAEAGEASAYDAEDDGDTVEGDLEMDLDAVDAAAEASDADGDDAAAATLEGDTVEGDLEMDLDAIDAADDGESTPDGRDDASSSGGDRPGTDGRTHAPPDARAPEAADNPVEAGEARERGHGSAGPGSDPDGSARTGAGSEADGGARIGAGSEADGGARIGAGSEADGGDGGTGQSADEDSVEQLDLADPTVGQEAEDEDEDDWNIPGQ